MPFRLSLLRALAALTLSSALGACHFVDVGPAGTPTPTASPTSTPSPTPTPTPTSSPTPTPWAGESVTLTGDVFARADLASGIGSAWTASGVALRSHAAVTSGTGAAQTLVFLPHDVSIAVDYVAGNSGTVFAVADRSPGHAVAGGVKCAGAGCSAVIVSFATSDPARMSGIASPVISPVVLAQAGTLSATGSFVFSIRHGALSIAQNGTTVVTATEPAGSVGSATAGSIGFYLQGTGGLTQILGRSRTDHLTLGAVGDSISYGFDSDSSLTVSTNFHDFSWATGDQVTSHAGLLQPLAQLPVVTYNESVIGAHGVDMGNQTTQLLKDIGGDSLDYVTMLIGANDLCHNNPADFSASGFQSLIASAVANLVVAQPNVKILIPAVPDITQLAQYSNLTAPQLATFYAHASNPLDPLYFTSIAVIAFIDSELGLTSNLTTAPSCGTLYQSVCPNIYASGTAANLTAMNAAFAAVAKQYPHNVMFADETMAVTGSLLSAVDCFHPSGVGQNLLGQSVVPGQDGQSTLARTSWLSGWFNRP